MKTNKEEFLKILSDYQGILHKVNMIYFRNIADREDNFQEVAYQLFKSYPSLKNRDSIGSWIYKVAINTSISKLKKESVIQFNNYLPEVVAGDNIENDIYTTESSEMLVKAIYSLNEIDKAIMLLYLEEKSYGEISNIIGITKSNVGVRINRAKEILKKKLKHLSYEKE